MKHTFILLSVLLLFLLSACSGNLENSYFENESTDDYTIALDALDTHIDFVDQYFMNYSYSNYTIDYGFSRSEQTDHVYRNELPNYLNTSDLYYFKLLKIENRMLSDINNVLPTQ